MQKTLLSNTIVFLVLSVLFGGCSNLATPGLTTEANAATSVPAAEVNLATETSIPVQESTPTQAPIPVPTATPEPIPCNLAFDTNRDGNWEIYSMAPDGSNTLNLTDNPGDDIAPAWSPDGKQIAFVSNRENGQEGGQFIYIMNADGSELRQLTTENDSHWPDWSQDGSMITYTSYGDIYMIRADGSAQSVNLTNSPEKDWKSTWSPDGSKIAWLLGDGWKWNVFVMAGNGSNIRQITDNGQVADVKWTVDGRLFTGWGWSDQQEFCHNCVVDADGSNITDAGGKGELQRYLPFWTADGKRVEVANVDLITGDNEIFLVSEIYPDIFYNLTNNSADDRNPDWPANCGTGSEAAVASSPADPGMVVIGYAGDDQWQWQRKYNFQKACDELGIQCVYGEIPELLEMGVSAIVQNSNAIAVDGLFASIMAAREKGIPVFVLDAESNLEGAYNITIDHHAWAETSLEWMFEKIGGEGQIAYFDLHPFNRYTDTINEMLKRYPDITVVEYRDGKYDREKVKPETVDFAKRYPELKAVWTSYNINNAIIGLDEEIGMAQEQWPVVMCEASMDGLDTWMRMKNAYPAFDCIAPVNPPGIAYDAVYAAYYLVSGVQIDQTALSGQFGNSLYVDIPIINQDNLQEWIDKTAIEHNTDVDECMLPEKILERWFVE